MPTNDERRRAAERLWDAFANPGTLAACLVLVLLVVVGLLLSLALVSALLTLLLVPLCGWSWSLFAALMVGELVGLLVVSKEWD